MSEKTPRYNQEPIEMVIDCSLDDVIKYQEWADKNGILMMAVMDPASAKTDDDEEDDWKYTFTFYNEEDALCFKMTWL